MADIEGVLSALDGADTADLDGELVRDGALATDDGLDAPALAGWVASWGDLGATDTADALGLPGEIVRDGALGATDLADVPALAGWVASWGDLGATDLADVPALAGWVASWGDLGATDTADAPALAGWVASWGDLGATEAADPSGLSGELATIVAAEPPAYTRYTCRLTGTPDLVLPISGFSTRLRTGSPSYLSVTVPDATEYAEAILDRQDGDILVTRTLYDATGAVLSAEDIATANFYGVRTERGSTSFAAVLTGYKQQTTTAYNIVYLEGLTYRADTYDANGELTGITVRARPHNSLLPGHTARVRDTDGGWLDIVSDMIAYSVSGQGETFEVTGVPAA